MQRIKRNRRLAPVSVVAKQFTLNDFLQKFQPKKYAKNKEKDAKSTKSVTSNTTSKEGQLASRSSSLDENDDMYVFLNFYFILIFFFKVP